MTKTTTDKKGWIKLHRKFLDWEWYSEPNVAFTFIHLLISANYEDKNWKGTLIKRGQLAFGRIELAKSLNISQQQLRTCLTKLKSTNEITIKTTSRFSILTIVKYNEYQSQENEVTSKSTSSATNEQPASNQQATTTKETKNSRSKEVKKDIGVILPEWVPSNFGIFLEERLKLKTRNSDHAIKLLLTDLEKLKAQGQNLEKVINQSIVNSWKGLFAVKEDYKAAKVNKHSGFDNKDYSEGLDGFKTI